MIILLSFEWSSKTLKCLQVTGLKVEVRGRGSGGEVENLEKKGCNKEMEEKARTAPFEKSNSKGCATRFKSQSQPP